LGNHRIYVETNRAVQVGGTITQETVMIEHFGAEYESYRRSVKGLIPFIW